MSLKTIIAGGRATNLTAKDFAFLDHISEAISEVVVGGAPGVDTAAEAWARDRGLKVKVFHAHWTEFGKSAGPVRNIEMAEYAAGGICIVFPGGRGTDHMAGTAKDYSITLIDRRHIQ